MNSDEHRLLVFHERELQLVLEKLGLSKRINERKLRCSICGNVITETNFGAIFKKGNKIHIICDSLKCLEKVRSER